LYLHFFEWNLAGVNVFSRRLFNEARMITEEQFREAINRIMQSGFSDVRAIVAPILVIETYFFERYAPKFLTGASLESSGTSEFVLETDSGVELRALCQYLGVSFGEDEIQPKVAVESGNLAAGGIGAVVSIALAKRLLSRIVEKIEDPNIRAILQSVISLLG